MKVAVVFMSFALIVLGLMGVSRADVIYSGPVTGATTSGGYPNAHIAFDLDSSNYAIGWYPTTGAANEVLFRVSDMIADNPQQTLRGVAVTGSNNYLASRLGEGAVIGPDSYWTGWAYIAGSSGNPNQEWVTGGDVEGFAGLKLMIDNQTHYGWAHLAFDSSRSEWSLLGWAYEEAPNTAIHAVEIPEPTSLALLAVGGVAILTRRRNKWKKHASAD